MCAFVSLGMCVCVGGGGGCKLLVSSLPLKNCFLPITSLAIKSVVDAGVTVVLVACCISLKQRPISFLGCLDTAHISLNDLGTSSCRHAMNRQAAAMASLARPLSLFSSCTCLKRVLHLSCE